MVCKVDYALLGTEATKDLLFDFYEFKRVGRCITPVETGITGQRAKQLAGAVITTRDKPAYFIVLNTGANAINGHVWELQKDMIVGQIGVT